MDSSLHITELVCGDEFCNCAGVYLEVTLLSDDFFVMLKDTPVMRINYSTGLFEVIDEKRLPWGLRNAFVKLDGSMNRTQYSARFNRNSDAFKYWLESRVLPADRANARLIYNALNLGEDQAGFNKTKVALYCKGLSLQDNYWIKPSGFKKKWSDIDLHKQHCSKDIAQIALHGDEIKITCEILSSPEFTTNGAYAKCWKREDGKLWLYKYGNGHSWESRVEIMVSNLLDNMNIEHIRYYKGTSRNLECCKCECMTNDKLSMLTGMEFISWCNRAGLNPDIEILRIDSDRVYKMWIVDYLISNRDRHGLNWGFYYDCDTMEILGCHPLFDHNNAFDIEYMKNPNASYQFGGMSIRDAAHYAIKRTKIEVMRAFEKSDFLTERQYKSFMSRAKELGII